MCNYYNCFKSINDVERIKFMVTDARKRANNKWDKNNKERLLYLNKRLTALEGLKAIRYTMTQTHGLSPQLLISKYIERKKEWQVQQDIHISHNIYPKYKELALCEFANAWVITWDKFGFDEEDRIELRIFDTKKSL